MKILAALLACCFFGCASPIRKLPDSAFSLSEPIIFRGGGTFRLNDINSRGGMMAVNEIIVTRSDILALAYDAKNRRPFSTAKIAQANVARVSDDSSRFVKLEMRDGSTHWVEIYDKRKADFLKALSSLVR